MGNIVHLQDCMIGMAATPDKYYELAIVDPPYGIGVNKMTLGNGKNKINRGSQNWDGSIPNSKYFVELFRVSRNQIIWEANYMTNHLIPASGWIFWNKGTGSNDYADGELAWTSFDRVLKMFTKSWVWNNAKDGITRIHPTQKPVALYKWLLRNYAKPGDKILDTHVGSGSSRIACYDGGFDFTGYEIDPDYHAAQEKRFKQHIAQLTLSI